MSLSIPQVTDILASVKGVAEYTNLELASVNDHVIRVGVMTEPFYWHRHPNSDETFLVIEGSIYIDLEGTTIHLHPGQLFTVAKNTTHRTRPHGARSVNITIEKNDTETVKEEKSV